MQKIQTRTKGKRWTITAALAGAWLAAAGAQGAGLLIADGGFGGVLEIEQHEVDVTINNNVAVTRVAQVFRNTEQRQVEALYTFPVPKGASVANFSMWINGKEMIGEVLEKERARQIYDSYKQTRKDPGLLEQVDYKTFEMRIFPIGPGAEQRVEIVYYQELDPDHDWATYVYPLATATRPGLDSRVQGTFRIGLQVQSVVPIRELESPSHGDAFAVAAHAETYYEASLEQRGGDLARDVVLAYQLKRPRTGIDLITSRQPGEDGFFSLILTAGEDLEHLDQGLDYVFVLDVSGSMQHDGKLGISRESIDAFMQELGPADRFEVLAFNVQPTTLFGALAEASEDNRGRAARFLADQQARGGTSLLPAVQTAYRYGDPDRTLNVVILSDGMTEQKERRILGQLIASRPRHVRVFCIGVGNEVNRPLLEQIADESGGLAAFVSQGDDFARQAKAFRRKLMRPVAANLALRFDGVEVYDLEPRTVPNLYHGSPVRVYGRYRGQGTAEVVVSGDIAGRAWNRTMPLAFPAADEAHPEIERMWAWKRIDHLQKDADRAGDRTAVINEIVALGETYSIVSEYTSFLVLENDAEYQRWKIERRNARRMERDRAAQAGLQASLDRIRGLALADLGPQPAVREAPAPTPAAQPAAPRVEPSPLPAANRPAPPRPTQSFDFGSGTGPVGPFFVGLSALLARRKRRVGQPDA